MADHRRVAVEEVVVVLEAAAVVAVAVVVVGELGMNPEANGTPPHLLLHP
jgi:hypothetical protein